MIRINCIQYRDGKCLHQAAPRGLFFQADCILVEPAKDPMVLSGCALQVKRLRPVFNEPVVPQPLPFR